MIVAALFAGVLSAGEFVVEATVASSPRLQVGDRTELRIMTRQPQGWSAVPPEPPPFLGDFRATVKSPGSWILVPLEGGQIVVPPIEVRFESPDGKTKTAVSEPIAVRVRSAVRPGRSPADLEPLAGRPVSWMPVLIGIVAAAAVLLATKRFWRTTRDEPDYLRPDLSNERRVVAAATAVRGWVGGKSATSDETVAGMRRLPEAVRREAAVLLETADAVKFGALPVSDCEAADAIQAADAVRRAVQTEGAGK